MSRSSDVQIDVFARSSLIFVCANSVPLSLRQLLSCSITNYYLLSVVQLSCILQCFILLMV